MSNTEYSVLMSVYAKENPDYLKESINSILAQTVKTDDFVIVLDGPLTPELDKVIEEFTSNYPDIFNIVAFKENRGLGLALRDGVLSCRHEIILRQDSDDISVPERSEKQLLLLSKTNSDVISGTIEEFSDSTTNITGKRTLPLTHEEILKFSKKRNPFNHPAIMFRKSAVVAASNYSEEYHLFEDYHLWIKMLMNGAKAANLEETCVFMRVDSNTYLRRGGRKYASDMIRFHKWIRNKKWSSTLDFLTGAVPHYIVCVMPSFMRKAIYKILH